MFKAILRILSNADLNVFFEENLKLGYFLLPAIYLHVKKDYLCSYCLFQSRCTNLVHWKDSFEKINAELDLTKRKKQTLDDLHSAGRISQFAYECLNKGLTEEIEQAEGRRKALAEKMTNKLNELEEQRIALEMFLANTEMAHAAGEIDEDLYAKESGALDLGLEATKQELNWIKEVILQLSPKENDTAATPQTTPAPAETAEAAATETTIEKTTETASNVPVAVPVELATTTSEVNVEQVPSVPTETPSTPQPTTSEGGEAPFREQGEEKP